MPTQSRLMGGGGGEFEYLTVTVIPLESNLNPYAMSVEIISDQDKNLK